MQISSDGNHLITDITDKMLFINAARHFKIAENSPEAQFLTYLSESVPENGKIPLNYKHKEAYIRVLEILSENTIKAYTENEKNKTDTVSEKDLIWNIIRSTARLNNVISQKFNYFHNAESVKYSYMEDETLRNKDALSQRILKSYKYNSEKHPNGSDHDYCVMISEYLYDKCHFNVTVFQAENLVKNIYSLVTKSRNSFRMVISENKDLVKKSKSSEYTESDYHRLADIIVKHSIHFNGGFENGELISGLKLNDRDFSKAFGYADRIYSAQYKKKKKG